MGQGVLRRAIETTFELRGTHAIAVTVPEAPEFWMPRFLTVAKECPADVTLREALNLTGWLAINCDRGFRPSLIC
jgi:hypothetical protein